MPPSRGALESLVESLDATVRLARWDSGGNAAPEPLKKSASQLVQRLGAATRLASGKFVGAPAVVASSDAIRSAVSSIWTRCSRLRATGSGPRARSNSR